MSESQTRLSLRVSPGASSSAVVGRYGERWKVRVAAPAEAGKANEALLGLLGEVLGVTRSRLRVVSGAGARDKIVEVIGVDAEESGRLLETSAGEGEANEGKRA
ncbi:MAG: DUF167 domain-containing protein [Gaiellaceae bacterium]|jgi:uncharacterized protein (TIGR00251 family)